jgi:hypothetical protein
VKEIVCPTTGWERLTVKLAVRLGGGGGGLVTVMVCWDVAVCWDGLLSLAVNCTLYDPAVE